MDSCGIISILLTSCRKPLLTIKTSTYHFCKMSLVKSSFTHATESGSSSSASDVEPQIVPTENAECHGVNPTIGPQEHDQCIEATLKPLL
jgi:protein decreased size exclusion limit 1